MGRFLQEDTYRGDGLNLYVYCANNPVAYYDPSGNKHKKHKEIRLLMKMLHGIMDGELRTENLQVHKAAKNRENRQKKKYGMATDPKGRQIGIEVKSGSARKTRAQREFDKRVSKNNPAKGIGKHKDAEIGYTITIRR